MSSTFNVISLGILDEIDTVEGNNTAENADDLVGMTFGGPGDSLHGDFQTMSHVGDPDTFYDMNNNNADDQFSIDGGSPQTFDGTSVYNATIVYDDGTSAQITAVLFQDTDGNSYLAPEYAPNADQDALEAGPIQSISLDSLAGNSYSGMYTSRENWDFVTCFVKGAEIETANGPVAVENLRLGDLVRTMDHGMQPLRWIGHRMVQAKGSLAPIKITKGALGNTVDLLVSPQHRVLLSGWRAEIYCGQAEVLAAAKSLLNGDTISHRYGGDVTYYHIMFDQHELVFSAGIPSESFHPSHMGWEAMSEKPREEILTLFPELRTKGIESYGRPVRPVLKSHEVQLLFP